MSSRSGNNLQTDSMMPVDYREISICPEQGELLIDQAPILRKNIVLGKYDSISDYLDIQFRLLREDFIRPLRENITEYIHTRNELNPAKRAKLDKKLCVYRNVLITGKVKRYEKIYLKCKYDCPPCEGIDPEVGTFHWLVRAIASFILMIISILFREKND